MNTLAKNPSWTGSLRTYCKTKRYCTSTPSQLNSLSKFHMYRNRGFWYTVIISQWYLDYADIVYSNLFSSLKWWYMWPNWVISLYNVGYVSGLLMQLLYHIENYEWHNATLKRLHECHCHCYNIVYCYCFT